MKRNAPIQSAAKQEKKEASCHHIKFNEVALQKSITSENLAITLKALVDGKPSSKQLEAMTATAYAPNLIHELNRRGWKITNEKREGKNRKGKLVRYGVYALDPKQLGDAVDALICYKRRFL